MALGLSEHYTLRVLTGRVIGESLYENFINSNIWIITSNSLICSSFASSLAATIVSKQAGLVNIELLVIDDNTKNEEISKFVENKDMVVLAFGGEFDWSTNTNLTKKILETLSDIDYEGDIFFHVRIWAPGIVKELYLNNDKIKGYLNGRIWQYTFTFDLEKGLFKLQEVFFENEEIDLIVMKEMPLTHIHLELLKASL